MKGYDSSYNEVSGLNPFEQEIKDVGRSLESQAKHLAHLGGVYAYFAGFEEATSDDISGMSAYSDGLSFKLAVKDSKFVHALAQFTGLNFVKSLSYDGQSITLTAEVPEEHRLFVLGVKRVFVSGYLPESCKVVVKEYKPLTDAEREVYETLLASGRPVYATDCTGDAIPEEVV